MELPINKYHGAGNDFLMLNNLSGSLHLDARLISALCDRHFGIGADGLIMLEAARDYDFTMRYYNSDGRESTMCGNGGRCITAFALMEGAIGNKVVFQAADGLHEASILDASFPLFKVKLQMRDVQGFTRTGDDIVINTGSPHYVTWRTDPAQLDILSEAHAVRYSPIYALEGINVNFAGVSDEGLFVRTYERGVEAETLSCGTGVTATAMAYAIRRKLAGRIETDVTTAGGNLKVTFIRNEDSFSEVWLLGPVKFVFKVMVETSFLI
jgi:diaminopimelate epimerase